MALFIKYVSVFSKKIYRPFAIFIPSLFAFPNPIFSDNEMSVI